MRRRLAETETWCTRRRHSRRLLINIHTATRLISDSSVSLTNSGDPDMWVSSVLIYRGYSTTREVGPLSHSAKLGLSPGWHTSCSRSSIVDVERLGVARVSLYGRRALPQPEGVDSTSCFTVEHCCAFVPALCLCCEYPRSQPVSVPRRLRAPLWLG